MSRPSHNLKNRIRKNRRKKTEAYSIISRLYHFLRLNPDNVFFRRLGGHKTGDYDPKEEEIRLDYRKDIIPTLIHEFLHHLYPNMCETKIKEKERQTMSKISPRQGVNIIRALGSYLQTSKY